MKRIVITIIICYLAFPGFAQERPDSVYVEPESKHIPLQVDDFLQFAPAAALLLPDAVYPGNRYGWKERVCLVITAELINEAIVQPVKHLVHSRRPDGTDNHGFPSGHAARAFMGAELLRISCGTWPAMAGYAVATTVGVLRITSRRHHFIDVLGGAATGVLAANLAHLLLPFERKLFKLQRSNETMAIAPVVGESNVGLSLVYVF